MILDEVLISFNFFFFFFLEIVLILHCVELVLIEGLMKINKEDEHSKLGKRRMCYIEGDC
jgi:hypothetical protein